MLHAIEKAKTGILTNPALQDVLRRAVNLRTDLLDQFDHRMEGVARKLNLATRKETKALRRQIRELENQVQGMEGQLMQERRRADEAELALSEALKATKKIESKAKPAQLALAPEPSKAVAPVASVPALASELELEVANEAPVTDEIAADSDASDAAESGKPAKRARAKKKADDTQAAE